MVGAASKTFTTILFRWFKGHRRDLPWRRTRDPYHILVSEIMLQQTQVDRVTLKYPKFLARFPTLESLATASTADVIKAWSGMGYNRRALNLQKFTQAVQSDFGGLIPRDPTVLKTLPGMGPVTAASFAAFAYGADVPSLDTNIRRILQRLFHGMKKDASFDELYRTGLRLITSGKGWEWNSAMMDFGSTVCTARRPLCRECPFRTMCKAYPAVLTAPAKRPPKKREPQHPDFPNPNRIYRGRIVEFLRNRPRATLPEIGRVIESRFTSAHLPWLREILRALAADGLIALSPSGASAAIV